MIVKEIAIIFYTQGRGQMPLGQRASESVSTPGLG